MSEPVTHDPLDWVHQRLPALLVWKLPAVVLVVSVLVPLPDLARGSVWTLALGTMGLACLRNALRCGRMHCYFTAPLFLGLAFLSLLHGTDTVGLGPSGWAWIGGTALVGGVRSLHAAGTPMGSIRRTRVNVQRDTCDSSHFAAEGALAPYRER